ncbi:MAG: extensin family protein [Hyphomicrobiales bacterium]|nr:extensin family protein [Hyphomicrobiales bacterium]
MRRVLLFLSVAAVSGAIAGCSVYEKAKRPAWRTAEENACFAEKRVQLSSYIQPYREISGPGICGLTRPLKTMALQGGAVRFNTTQTLDCSMVANLESWVADVVQPAATARFGAPVVQINSMGSYSCRGMNNQTGARLSEHSFGNALDIGGFRLADGRDIVIRRDWTRGDEQTQAFLREVQGGACDRFTTVLAPGSNAFHYDHIHVDLAMHGNTRHGLRRICKPLPPATVVAPPSAAPPRDNLPDPPEVEEETDIAQAKTLPGQNAYALHNAPDFGAPPQPLRSPARIESAARVGGPMPLRTQGALRPDGAFVPPDDIGDETSAISPR